MWHRRSTKPSRRRGGKRNIVMKYAENAIAAPGIAEYKRILTNMTLFAMVVPAFELRGAAQRSEISSNSKIIIKRYPIASSYLGSYIINKPESRNGGAAEEKVAGELMNYRLLNDVCAARRYPASASRHKRDISIAHGQRGAAANTPSVLRRHLLLRRAVDRHARPMPISIRRN